MKRYLNTKLYGQRETVDELDSKDFESMKAFNAEKKRLIAEYRLAGGFGELYWSQRKCSGQK